MPRKETLSDRPTVWLLKFSAETVIDVAIAGLASFHPKPYLGSLGPLALNSLGLRALTVSDTV
ncbi:MAG: hypothetical protein ACI8T1_002859 [Verrucomicrobiales bacterium]|jgi:hypothetical protein